uniref:Tropomodulin n=1 Tax=Ascaris lumbricoides TaxID=6252 RepID=A0A9J2P125_ASCLU
MADDGGEVMTDADFEKALDALREQEPNGEVGELLKMMNENRMISWEEAEQILGGSSYNEPIKSSLPEQTRPTEPDNDTDVDDSIQKLLQNDPKLKEINLNNMKRTPIPQVKRLIAAIRDNTFLEKLSLANMGLYDSNVEEIRLGLQPLIDVVEKNSTLKAVNLETNYLSGDFFAKLFQAALKNQTLEEVKAVNQGVTFSTTSEKEIIDAIFANRGIIKVSINLRLPEGRHKIENAMLRNGEIKRVLRRQAAQAAKAADEANQKAEQKTTTKKTDEVKKSSPKKAATKASTGTTKVTPTKDGTTTAAKTPTEAPAMIATGAAAKTLTKTPAKSAAKTPTKSAAKAPATKANTAEVPTEEDKKTEAKATAKPLAKTAPKVPAKTTTSTKASSKSTAAKAAADSSTTEATTKAPAKPAATTASAKQPDTSATKPAAKTAPAVPPKKATISKTATDKPASAEKSEAAATAKEATASKTTSKKTATKKVEQPMAVYPLKKSQKQ